MIVYNVYIEFKTQNKYKYINHDLKAFGQKVEIDYETLVKIDVLDFLSYLAETPVTYLKGTLFLKSTLGVGLYLVSL